MERFFDSRSFVLWRIKTKRMGLRLWRFNEILSKDCWSTYSNLGRLTQCKLHELLHEWFLKTYKRVEEATGVWLECDTQATDFDRCLFHQAADDNLDYDRNGIVTERGLVRIYSPPQHQWGSRCLSIRFILIFIRHSQSLFDWLKTWWNILILRFKTSTSITVAVSGTFVDEGQGSATVLL